MKKSFCFLFIIWFVMATAGARTYSLSSPDSRIRIEVDTREKVNWSVFYDDILILEPSGISLTLDSFGTLGLNPRIINQESHSVDQGIQSFVPVKSSIIADKYNELVISFRGEYRIAFRAYDNGVAYRFITEIENELIIRSEEINYSFPGNYDVILTHTEGFITHQEALFREMKLSDMADSGLYFPPALVRIKGGPVLLLTEADLFDYPGTYYRKGDGYSLKGVQPGFVLKERQINDRTVIAEERADYIAETTGTRSYPWRVICIAGEEKDLLSNQLVYLLSRPLELENTGWIKPGKVAWDWWNANNISGVDFKSGINTETYLHYIDFAAEYGLEYIILDEGWCHPSDHFRVTPGMDLEAICNYGMEKGVGIILWVVWKTLDNQLEESLAWFEKLGVKGIKVDFMQRDDQWMVNYYLKIARKAAEHNLLVDFHGSYKPSGLRRAYPNVMTREGILGMEHSKWGTDANPDHNVTAPFIRMVAGPMDYTPGAMDNAHPRNFMARFERPMSIGTRCHQLAMYVVFESPLQMLADNPTNYRREAECTRFISKIPTVWDETVVLDARVGEYILLARRRWDTWYIGAMTNSEPRDLELDLSFLPGGSYTLEQFADGINADRNAQDYKRTEIQVVSGQKLKIHLAPGGGWAGKI